MSTYDKVKQLEFELNLKKIEIMNKEETLRKLKMQLQVEINNSDDDVHTYILKEVLKKIAL